MATHFQPMKGFSNIQADIEMPPPKRRRVPVACSECRARKSRCNGARPKCSTCHSIRATCVYEQPALKSFYTPSTGAEFPFETRMRALEEKIDSLSRVRSSPRELFGMQSPPSDGAQSFIEDSSRNFFHVNSQSAQHERHAAATSEDVDGMCTLIWSADENTTRIFGLSSNISLFREVTQAAVQATNVNIAFMNNYPMSRLGSRLQKAGTLSASPLDTSMPRSVGRATENEIHPELPSESEANILIQHFFTSTGVMIPCVHMDSFLIMYEKARREGFKSCRPSWLALMNMIFAVAISSMHVHSPLPNMLDEAETYYKTALRLVSLDMLVTTSLELVHVLLLMEVFLQGSQSSMQVWTFHALAVKSALQLGLHSAESSKRLTPLDQEIRKRTWFWCVINDRMHSAMFGQPPMIMGTDHSLELPTNNNDEFPASSFTSSIVLRSADFFNTIISLSSMMEEAVEQLYNRNLDFQKSICTSEIIIRKCRLSEKVFNWQRALPEDLQIISSTEILNRTYGNPETARFRGFLTLLYLGLRALMTRPIVLEFLRVGMNPQNSDFEWTLLQSSGISDLRECIEACRETISLVSSILVSHEKGTNLIGLWWFSAYYTFNASLIISAVLLASKEPKVSSLISPAFAIGMRSSLNQAHEVLQSLDNGNIMISRCRASLGRLLDVHESLSDPSLLTPSLSTPSWPNNDALSQEMCNSDSWDISAVVDPNFVYLDSIHVDKYSGHWHDHPEF